MPNARAIDFHSAASLVCMQRLAQKFISLARVHTPVEPESTIIHDDHFKLA